MHISITDAEGQLTELVRLMSSGNEIILTQDGQPVARLTPARPVPDKATRRDILDELQRAGAKALPGETAARSQDFLYDEYGLPK